MPQTPTVVRVVNIRSLVFWALAVYLLVQFIDAIALTLLLFGVAFFFAIVLDPPIRWLDRRGLSRGASAGIIALALLVGIGLTAYFAVPPIVDQAGFFAKNAPAYALKLQHRAEGMTARYPVIREQIEKADLAARLVAVGQNVLPQIGRFSLTLASGLFSLFFVFIITIYTVANPAPLVRGAVRALPRPHRRTALRVLARTSIQLQAWVRATFWMMLAIGLMSGLGLWLLGVKSPLLFGFIAGLGEAIPTVGPILSALPPFLVTLADDPTKALWVLVLFFFIQQLENNLLVPRIMASTMNLHAVSVLFFVVAMGALIGPLGILLATPLCAIVKVVYNEVYCRRMSSERVSRSKAEEVKG